MGWNYLTIPTKNNKCSVLMWEWTRNLTPTLNQGCDCLPTPGLKLNPVRETGLTSLSNYRPKCRGWHLYTAFISTSENRYHIYTKLSMASPGFSLRIYALWNTTMVTDSFSTGPIWRHWTYEMLVMYILSSLCLRLSQFCQCCFMQYMVVGALSLPVSLGMIVRIL